MKSTALRWSVPTAFLAAGVVVGTYFAAPAVTGQAPPPQSTPRELTSYRDVVKQVLPAVVSVESRATRKVRAERPQGRRALPPQAVPEEFRRFFEGMEEMPERDFSPNLGFGSGVIVDTKGVVLTNYHVVEGADSVEVTLQDGRKFVSKEIAGDRKTDLAIVKLPVKEGNLPWLEFADSDSVEVGDRVLAVGAPFGLAGTVTHGIVSAKSRNLNMNMYEDFVQTDAPINPGNSGGPLVGLDGRIVGVNSAIKSRSGGFQGVGLAISSNLAKSVMTQLQANGTVKRGYLGVQIRNLEADVAARLNVPGGAGVVVSRVTDDTPAAKAGLKNGDVVVSIAGKPVRDSKEMQRVVTTLPLGRPADVVVVRDGQSVNLKVTVEEQPEEYGIQRVPVPAAPRRDPATVKLDKFGFEVQELTAASAKRLGFPAEAKGVVVARVDGDGPAFQAGLREGQLVTRVDNKPVETPAELREALEKSAASPNGALLQTDSPAAGTGFAVLKVTQ